MSKPDSPKTSDISIDALFDDLFGLNLRALRTLGTSFKEPGKYSEAAWSPDWQDRYTPSFRLWFTLIAILFFFQFFWASNDGALVQAFADQMTARGTELPPSVNFATAASTYARVNFSLLPFTSALCLFLISFVFRAWAREPSVPYVVRARYVYLVSIPSTALTLPMFGLMGILPADQIQTMLAVTWALPIVIDSWVSYRSVYAHLQGRSRFFYSAALGLSIFVALLLSAAITNFLTILWINQYIAV